MWLIGLDGLELWSKIGSSDKKKRKKKIVDLLVGGSLASNDRFAGLVESKNLTVQALDVNSNEI